MRGSPNYTGSRIMAEGGGRQDNKDNPFSFKNFVKKSKSETSSSDDSDFESEEPVGSKTFDLLDVTRAKKKDKGQIVVEDDSETVTRKGDENPFSFKKFLQGGPKRSPNPSLPTFDLANDLPDFAQNHQPSELRGATSDKLAVEPLPSLFGADNREQNCVPENRCKDNTNGSLHEGDPSFSDSDNSGLEEEEEEEDHRHSQIGALSSGALPDFLSDSALTGGLGFQIAGLGNSGPAGSNSECAAADLRTLREENQELRCALQEANMRAEREAKRVREVQEEMSRTQKRDADETKALETMVQKVEANLVTTTKRAVKAENTIEKLKQEINSLQAETQSLRQENLQLRGHSPGGSTSEVVREKAKYAAQQLTTAATSAEQTLKQLLKGVENLRLVSDILTSIDTVTDLPQQQPPS